MRRAVVAVLALALLAAACGKDRYEPKFGAATKIVSVDNVTALTVDGNHLYYGDPATDDVYRVRLRAPHTRVLIERVPNLKSLAVFRGQLHVSSDGHIAVDRDGRIYESVGGRIMQGSTIISKGWVNPFAFSIDARNRLFVADQASDSGKERTARGRENDVAKRNRFSAVLPKNSKPIGLAILDDELLVCRSTYRDVFRLHVGIDNTPRNRGVVKGLACTGAIATMADGSVVTATAHEIRRYPPR